MLAQRFWVRAPDDDGVHGLAPALVRDAETATSSTPGCLDSTASTSTEYTFSPPVMIMSLARSTMKK